MGRVPAARAVPESDADAGVAVVGHVGVVAGAVHPEIVEPLRGVLGRGAAGAPPGDVLAVGAAAVAEEVAVVHLAAPVAGEGVHLGVALQTVAPELPGDASALLAAPDPRGPEALEDLTLLVIELEILFQPFELEEVLVQSL